MAEDQPELPKSLLPYQEWTESALRQVVVWALAYVAKNGGLPGGHHFYISFRTDYPGVELPARVRAQYPHEITIVLQHQFWDLVIDETAGLFRVGLSFSGVPTTITVPFAAITAFADPQVQYGLRFTVPKPEELAASAPSLPQPEAPATPEPGAPEPEARTQPDATPQVVQLDAFRRRPTKKD